MGSSWREIAISRQSHAAEASASTRTGCFLRSRSPACGGCTEAEVLFTGAIEGNDIPPASSQVPTPEDGTSDG